MFAALAPRTRSDSVIGRPTPPANGRAAPRRAHPAPKAAEGQGKGRRRRRWRRGASSGAR